MEPLQYEARGYLKEPFRLFHLADGRGEYIEYHYHTFHKIIILLAGRAGYAVEGERYELVWMVHFGADPGRSCVGMAHTLRR